jgi:hypothetical protein
MFYYGFRKRFTGGFRQYIYAFLKDYSLKQQLVNSRIAYSTEQLRELAVALLRMRSGSMLIRSIL